MHISNNALGRYVQPPNVSIARRVHDAARRPGRQSDNTKEHGGRAIGKV